jgi:hypothetical protein
LWKILKSREQHGELRRQSHRAHLARFLPFFDSNPALTMSASPPPSSEELFSAAYDSGHWDAASVPELSDENAAQLASAWQQLGDDLRSLPVTPVGNQFSANVVAQLRANAHPVVRITQTKTSSERTSIADQNAKRSIAIGASLAAIVLIALMLSGYPVQKRPDARFTENHQKLDPAAWEVVVVTVSDEQTSGLTAQLRESVSERGYQIHAVTHNASSSDDVLELVMASAETSEQFLDAMSSGTQPFTTEWNPDQIGEFDRDELLRRLAASMETPTQSDHFFGETFVILPNSEAMQIATVPTPQTSNSALAASRTSAAQNQEQGTLVVENEAQPDASVQARVVNLLQQNANRPVLVVFRKKPKLQSENRVTDPARDLSFIHKYFKIPVSLSHG